MRRSKATNIADPPPSNDPHYIFFGGKGGVGKTTCAAAAAIHSARHGAGTLLVSTDPAPSLGDALRQRLGAEPRPVRGLRRLHAVEIDSIKALDAWIANRRATLQEVALRGTWLDREDVSRLLELSLPGIDEIAALLQLIELAGSGRYQRIIVDTAPTGHLLRMLAMPAVLGGVAQVFDRMQAKHRMIVEALRGFRTPDAADALIDEMRGDAQRMSLLLRDSTRARVSWLTLPEPMSVEEATDGIAWLTREGITVDAVIVNRLTPTPPQPCRWCVARRDFEARAIERVRRSAPPGARVITLPAVDPEPRGISPLRRLGALMHERASIRPRRGSTRPAIVRATLQADSTAVPRIEAIRSETRLIMFGGKGGVGKTTCATATALSLAAMRKDRRILLLSADPAHSVGDALGHGFSDVPAPVPGAPDNLRVRELDAERVFKAARARFSSAVADLFARLSAAGSVESSLANQDRQVIDDLLELAPPGVDELVAITEVHDSLNAETSRPQHDLVIIDTAPTGHALRLIEMPALVHAWVKAIMAILLKYQPIVGVGELGVVLLRLSQGLGRLRDAMSNPRYTTFIVVTRAAALPRAETVRLVERLRGAGLDVPAVIVNAVGLGTCSRCRVSAAAEEREIAGLERALAAPCGRTPAVLLAPAEMPPPHGARRLRAWRETWRIRAVSHES